MGFIWSKPRGPLEDSLIDDYPVFLRMGDLLLVPTSELDITLNRDLWKHVALVISSSKVFTGGQMLSLERFISKHDCCLTVRQLESARPSGFETRFVSAVADAMAKSYAVRNEYRECFEIGYVLANMGFISEACVRELSPHHFSSETPYRKLDLHMYSMNVCL